jgi:class 3 adenylate cyclase
MVVFCERRLSRSCEAVAVGIEAPSGTVTLLFTDIEGWTGPWESAPEAMQVALQRHDDLLRSAIETARGYIFKTAGDAFCAAFTSARDAVKSACAAQQALQTESWPERAGLRVRMALHTGECEERDGDYFGPAVDRAARLEATAHGGQVLCSSVTSSLAADQLPEGASLRDLDRRQFVPANGASHPETSRRVLWKKVAGQR